MQMQGWEVEGLREEGSIFVHPRNWYGTALDITLWHWRGQKTSPFFGNYSASYSPYMFTNGSEKQEAKNHPTNDKQTNKQTNKQTKQKIAFF